MTHDHDEADLAGVDLQLWRVPPPPTLDRSALLVRALSPAAAPPNRRARMAWIVTAIVVINAAVAALILMFARPTPTVVTVQAAGGGPVDAQVRELLQRLDREQRELERKLAEIQELRELVVELWEKVRQLEQQRDRTMPKPRVERLPAVAPAVPTPAGATDTCDEVSCVLTNHKGGCCTKYRRSGVPMPPDDPAPSTLPETLDRASISSGIGAVKARVAACGRRSTVKGVVKVTVRVGGDGRVTSVIVKQAPDAVLGACVANQVKTAVFAETQLGGSFGYPFVF